MFTLLTVVVLSSLNAQDKFLLVPVDSFAVMPPAPNGMCYTFYGEDKAKYIVYDDGSVHFEWQPPIDILTNTSVVTSTANSRTNIQSQVIAQNVTFPSTGQYDITISFGHNADANTSDCRVAAEFDGQPLMVNASGDNDILRIEPKDSAGTAGSTGSLQKDNYERTFTKDIAAGNYFFALQVYPETNGVEASVWDARVEFVRRK